jgi:hypothetical protein
MNAYIGTAAIAIVLLLVVMFWFQRWNTASDRQEWGTLGWGDKADDLIEDEGLVDRLVDRATSAAATDEAIRRVGERSELLMMTYIKVLKEWGY